MSGTGDGFGSVTIGPREIYDRLGDVDRKVDRLIADQDGLRERVADQELRIRTLERARWPLPSLAVLLSLGALLVGLAGLFIKGG